MRELKDYYSTHIITEKDYHRLLVRFDLSRAEDDENDSNYNSIYKPCLCHWYSCSNCPIWCCSSILAVNSLRHFYSHLYADSIGWHKNDDMEARREIQAIRDYLLGLPRLMISPSLVYWRIEEGL